MSLRASFLNEILEISTFGKSDIYVTEKIDSTNETNFGTFLKYSRPISQSDRQDPCVVATLKDTEAKDDLINYSVSSLAVAVLMSLNVNNYQKSYSESAFFF